MALTLLGGIIDGVMWQYKTERADLRRQQAETALELERAKVQIDDLRYQLDAATLPASCE